MWVSGRESLLYVVNFANDPTATVPAAKVVVTTTIDPNLDVSSLSLDEISFAG